MKSVKRCYLTRDLFRELVATGFNGIVFDTNVRGLFAQVIGPEVNFFMRVKLINGKRKTFNLFASCGVGSGGYAPRTAREIAVYYLRIYGDNRSYYSKVHLEDLEGKCPFCMRWRFTRPGKGCCLRCEIDFRYHRFARWRDARINNDLYELKKALKESRS